MLNRTFLPDIGVLALVYHEWSSNWMTPHHVLTRLAQYFRVVWMNPAHEWRETWAGRRASTDATGLVTSPGFSVQNAEVWLPNLYYPQWLAHFTFDQRLRRARRLLVNQGCRKIILYIWHPQFKRSLLSIPFDLSCYHIDDEYSFSNVERSLDKDEAHLIETVDQVFIISPGLLEKKGMINPHTAFAPEGVDYNAYATPVAEPSDIALVPRPRIGYTGVLKKQLDWPLLLHLTQQHPEWSFVFVGPQAPHREIVDAFQELSRRRNVYFMGAKSVHDLTAYPQHFDACIMPYRADNYTKYIYPLKLHEYLASGRPIVATHIRSLHEFAGIISLADTSDEWSAAITAALDPKANTPECRTQRQAIAQKHDWQFLVEEIAMTIGRRLGQQVAERLEEELRAAAA